MSENASKGSFLKPDELQMTATKEKERIKRKSEEKEIGRREKKAIFALLVFMMATFS